jgi:hypothetical protein
VNYADIKTAIESYMHRTDLTAQLPKFIQMAEATMFRELNLREFEMSVTGTAVDSYIELPADFGSVSRLTHTVGGRERNIEYTNRPDDYTGSYPQYYSQEDNKLRLFPTSGNQEYKLYYLVNLEPLSDAVPSNWLSVHASDLYIYMASLEAAKWTRDGDQITLLSQLTPPLMESVRNLSKRKTQPNSGGLRVRIPNTLI